MQKKNWKDKNERAGISRGQFMSVGGEEEEAKGKKQRRMRVSCK